MTLRYILLYVFLCCIFVNMTCRLALYFIQDLIRKMESTSNNSAMNLKNHKGSNLQFVFKHRAEKCRVTCAEAEFLGEIQTKVFVVFLLVIHSHLTTALLEMYIFTQPLTVWRKEENLLEKSYPLPYGLRNPYRNLKSVNSQDYAQKPERDWSFMNSVSWELLHSPL